VIDLAPADSHGDVLSQPTRARLFALLDELKRPAGTAELADRLGMHPNGVRNHLQRLCEAGLVTRARARGARGRPPYAWTIASDARPGGTAPSAYRDLGRWLARAMPGRADGLRSIEAIGREIGRELAPCDEPDVAWAFESSLVALGFQPILRRREGTHLTFCLRNCPYKDAVRENQRAVCALHEGITRGLLEVLHPRAKLAAFLPGDPDEAGCLIELDGAPGGVLPG
jgi:predicted ArsR family transcriptional regulator